jgi:putative CRISPR-associated protein (TIGR02619 family)
MIYLCSTGTSAAKVWPAKEYGKYGVECIQALGGPEKASDILLKAMQSYSMDNDEHLFQLSAEIHSLARMPLTTEDTVVLLASETADGLVCAQAVARYLQARGFAAVVETVEGLQVLDPGLFAKKAVVNYLKIVLRYIDNHGAVNCVLNPTGGFKALVPYAVLLGMIRKVECRYIFEFSTQLISFPPLPVDFSHAGLESIKAVLELINRESAIHTALFEDRLTWEQRREFAVLFEKEGDQVTLSPAGFLLLEELLKPQPLTPYISREAIKGLVRLERIKGVNPADYLHRLVRNRESFLAARHGNAGEGLFWLKPGNTTDRYLVSEEDGWKLLVWEMCDHDEYDRMSAQSNLGATARGQRASRYAPFFRLDLQS